MHAAIALAALLNLAAADSFITASPESRTVPTASVTIREAPARARATLDEGFTESGAAPETTSVIVDEGASVSVSSAETTSVILTEDSTLSFPSAETTTVISDEDPTVSFSSAETTSVILAEDPTVSISSHETTTTVIFNEDPTTSSSSAKTTTVTLLSDNLITPPPSTAQTTIVILNTEPTASPTDDADDDWTEPGNPATTRSTTVPVLHPYVHYDFGIGTAWPRGTTKPKCTHWTRVGDTHNRWTQDVYTSTVTTTLLHKCGQCAIVWTTPHKGYAWAKVYDTVTADYPFTVTEVACRGPRDTDGYMPPPHTPTDPWSTKTGTQRYPSTIYVTYPDKGPSTITPAGVTSPTCTSSTMVYGGGGLRANKQLKWKFSTMRTVTKDCGTCALAWSTNYFWQNLKGDFYHYYTVTNEMYVATTLECGKPVPTEAHGDGPVTTTVTTAATTTTTP